MRIASSAVLPVLLCCGVTNCFRDGRYQLANSNNTYLVHGSPGATCHQGLAMLDHTSHFAISIKSLNTSLCHNTYCSNGILGLLLYNFSKLLKLLEPDQVKCYSDLTTSFVI